MNFPPMTTDDESFVELAVSESKPLRLEDVLKLLELSERHDKGYPEQWSVTCPALTRKLCKRIILGME